VSWAVSARERRAEGRGRPTKERGVRRDVTRYKARVGKESEEAMPRVEGRGSRPRAARKQSIEERAVAACLRGLISY
jgi:hypothetical protein